MFKFFLIILLFYNSLQKANVYFTREISPSSMVKMFKKLNVSLKGNVGLKVHTGEGGGLYFLRPDFLEEIYNYTNGTFIECNAAYEFRRHSTSEHKKLLVEHGWVNNSRRTVIMDEDPEKDFTLAVDDPIIITENIVGEHIRDFNSCLVLTHFKGHPMGGYGGALKQLSIGFASQKGKTWIHTGGKIVDWQLMDDFLADDYVFTSSMADAASSVVKYFRERGGIAFISVMANISLWCDCGGYLSPEPKIADIGILASTDPVAIDRAGVDILKEHWDIGTEEMLEQIKSLQGENTIAGMEKHKMGTQEYNLIDVDQEEQQQKEEIEEKDKGEGKGKDKANNNNSNNYNYIILITIICSVICILVIAGIVGFVKYMKKHNYRENRSKISLVYEKNE